MRKLHAPGMHVCCEIALMTTEAGVSWVWSTGFAACLSGRLHISAVSMHDARAAGEDGGSDAWMDGEIAGNAPTVSGINVCSVKLLFTPAAILAG